MFAANEPAGSCRSDRGGSLLSRSHRGAPGARSSIRIDSGLIAIWRDHSAADRGESERVPHILYGMVCVENYDRALVRDAGRAGRRPRRRPTAIFAGTGLYQGATQCLSQAGYAEWRRLRRARPKGARPRSHARLAARPLRRRTPAATVSASSGAGDFAAPGRPLANVRKGRQPFRESIKR